MLLFVYMIGLFRYHSLRVSLLNRRSPITTGD